MEVRARRVVEEERGSWFCLEREEQGLRTRRIKKKKARGWLASATVCVLLVGYTFLGAVMFLLVEGGSERPRARGVRSNGSWPGEEARQRAVDNIWEITVSLNILYKENWTRLAGQEMARFQEALVKRFSEEMAYTDEVRTPLPPDWTLAKAFLYSLSLLTTIGYGSMSPRTGVGKAMTMGYAALGIPLVLVYLSSVGSLLSSCARNVFSRSLCCCLCSNCGYCCYDEQRMQEKEQRMRRKRELEERLRSQEPFFVGAAYRVPGPQLQEPDSASDSSESRSAATFLAPLLLCLVVMVVYIGGGAAVLSRLDSSWSYLDSVFFCFLLLSTIGYGDSVPPDSVLSVHSRQRSSLGELTVWFCSIYILCGLALTAMCFHVVYDQVVHKLRHNYFLADVKAAKPNAPNNLKLRRGKLVDETSCSNPYLSTS